MISTVRVSGKRGTTLAPPETVITACRSSTVVRVSGKWGTTPAQPQTVTAAGAALSGSQVSKGTTMLSPSTVAMAETALLECEVC